MDQLELEVASRQERGKNAARRLRASGNVPATLYGLGKDPEAISIKSKTMVNLLSHRKQRNRVLNLSGGSSGHAMAVDWQVDPVEGTLLHVDLRRIDVTATVEAPVALITKGVAYGVKTEGGMEDVILREARVLCLPADMPESIEIDVTALKAGESVRLSDLETGGKFTILGEPSMVVVRIVGKRTGADDEDGEGEEAAEGEAPAAEAEEE